MTWITYDGIAETNPDHERLISATIFTDEEICGTLEEFVSWPDVYAWDVQPDVPLTTIAERCQSWLFFGLVRILTEASNETFSLQSYISIDGPSRLCTERLASVLESTGTRHLDVEPMLALSNRWLLHWLTVFEEVNENHEPYDSETFNILWSTALLLEKFGSTAGWTLPDVAQQINRNSSVQGILRAAGRCPALLKTAMSSLIDTWTTLSIPLAPEAFEDAQIVLHQDCTFNECNIFHKSYYKHEKQHTPDCKSDIHGATRGIDSTIVTSLIERKAIPLVHSVFKDAIPSIEAVDESLAPAFDAVSHVWAGGLGNPDANEMYQCQLEYLHAVLSAANTLRSTACYWIDTLCIPAQDDSLKSLAIDEMARIYASARRVLVLGPILQHIDVNGLCKHEIAIVIATSPWMTRSWTLQEAALAIQLDFRFRDGTINLDEVNYGPLRDRLLQVLWRRDVDKISNRQPEAMSSSQKLQSVWQELLHRTSTPVADIAAIIAVFIDRSASEVLNLPPNQRVAALLTSQTSLPTSLLFTRAEPSVNVWQPKLPKYADLDERLQSTTFFRVLDHNLLETSDLTDLYMMASTHPLVIQEEMVLHEVVDNKYFKIHFPLSEDPDLQRSKGKAKQPRAEQNGLLFMLPRSAVDAEAEAEDCSDHQGLCFIMKLGSHTAEKAVFYRCFRWVLMKNEILSTTKYRGKQTKSLASDVMLFPSSGVDELQHEYHLFLDMGFQDLSPLSWSRKQFYPFMQNSVLAANPLNFLKKVKVFVHVWIAIRLSMSIIYVLLSLTMPNFFLPMSTQFLNLAVSISGLVSIWTVYTQLSMVETRYISKHFKRHMQKVWAISFSTLDERAEQQKSATNRQLRRLLALSSLYCVMWFVILLIAMPYYLSLLWTDALLKGVPLFRRILAPIYMLQDEKVTGFGPGYVFLDTTWTVYCYLCTEALFRSLILVVTLWKTFQDQKIITDEHQNDAGASAGASTDVEDDAGTTNLQDDVFPDSRHISTILAVAIGVMVFLAGSSLLLSYSAFVCWTKFGPQHVGGFGYLFRTITFFYGGVSMLAACGACFGLILCFAIFFRWALPATHSIKVLLLARRTDRYVMKIGGIV